MRRFLEWWILFLLQISAIGVCYYFDIISWLWDNDITKISFLIIAVWFVMTIKCGYVAYQYPNLFQDRVDTLLDSGWFASDQCLSLGMLGTVLGFLVMMGSISTAGDISAIQEMLKTMSMGMSTALITTAVGMIFSNLLKLQLFICGRET